MLDTFEFFDCPAVAGDGLVESASFEFEQPEVDQAATDLLGVSHPLGQSESTAECLCRLTNLASGRVRIAYEAPGRGEAGQIFLSLEDPLSFDGMGYRLRATAFDGLGTGELEQKVTAGSVEPIRRQEQPRLGGGPPLRKPSRHHQAPGAFKP